MFLRAQALSRGNFTALACSSSLSRCLTARYSSRVKMKENADVKPYHAIPGDDPRFWPLNAIKLKRYGGFAYIDDKYEKYGPIFRDKHFPTGEVVFVMTPGDAETILRNETKYPIRMSFPQIDEYRERRLKPAGVFFGNGEEWYKHRSVISKKMLRPKEISQYVDSMNQIVTELIQHIRLVREPPGSEDEFEVKDIDNTLFRWSFEGVGYFVFNRRFGALQEPMGDQRAQSFIDSIQEFLTHFVAVLMLPSWFYKCYETKAYKKFTSGLSSMYEHVETFLAETVQEMNQCKMVEENERLNFLEYLLLSGKLGEEDLIASVIDLMFAGVDTTSNTVHWCLYHLGRNPDKLRKLEEEIHTVLKPGEIASEETLQRVPYLKAVVKETLRLYPIINNLPRKTQEDISLSGYRIPSNTRVSMCFRVMGRNPDLFPDPESFIPERWLGEDPEHPNFASLPFGFGVRMCVGRRLAELEMHLLLTRLVQEFSLQYPSNEQIASHARVITVPAKNVCIKFYDRT